jgi:hypothetical protein
MKRPRHPGLDRDVERATDRWYWVSTGGATGAVIVDKHGTIVDCAPIWRRWFLGREFTGLCEMVKDLWVRRLPEPKRRKIGC